MKLNYKVMVPDTIVIHCSATKPSMDIGAADISYWHRQKGWLAIGYHKVIRRNGEIEDGRPLNARGAHVQGHNDHTLGVCMVGGVNDKGKPEDNFTEAQWHSLYRLLMTLVDDQTTITSILGHYNLDSHKACPSFDVQEYMARNKLLADHVYQNSQRGSDD